MLLFVAQPSQQVLGGEMLEASIGPTKLGEESDAGDLRQKKVGRRDA